MSELWSVLHKINPYDDDGCAEADKELPDLIGCMAELNTISYYLCYGESFNKMPLTRKKINELISKDLDGEQPEDWLIYRRFVLWLDTDTQNKLVNVWLNQENTRDAIETLWIGTLAETLDAIKLDILRKFVNIYKMKKSQQVSSRIGSLFTSLSAEDIKDGCEIVSKSTPAVAVNLLKRSDIPEKYTIKGLRSLAKLSKQRDLDVKIDFDTLKNLGPKSRLDAMKQLLGLFNSYYQHQKKYGDRYYYSYRMSNAKVAFEDIKNNSPFKTVPTKEEVKQFLFPCSMKYNDEVVELINRFEEIENQ